MKSIKPIALAIFIAQAAIPAWGMNEHLAVVSYSAVNKNIQQNATDLMSKEFSKVLGNPLEKTRLLIKGDDLIGALIYTDDMYENKKVRMIEYLAIDQQYRRQGYGKYFIQQIENDARKSNILTIQLDPRSGIEQFYLKLGFGFTDGDLGINMNKNLQLSLNASQK